MPTRETAGAISLSKPTHFAASEGSKRLVNPVRLPPGRAKLLIKPLPTGSDTTVNTTGTVCVRCLRTSVMLVPCVTITSGELAKIFATANSSVFDAVYAEANVEPQILAVIQAALMQSLLKSLDVELPLRIAVHHSHDDANAPHPRGLLCPRSKWRRQGRASHQRNEIAALHIQPKLRRRHLSA